jgi:phosphopentomutase
MGCKHINFFAYGPDFKKSQIINTKRELIDIPATIAELLQFKTVYLKGKVMHELFDNK